MSPEDTKLALQALVVAASDFFEMAQPCLQGLSLKTDGRHALLPAAERLRIALELARKAAKA